MCCLVSSRDFRRSPICRHCSGVCNIMHIGALCSHGKKITSTTPQHTANTKHNRAPCPTAPSAHASYKGYGFNNAKPPRAPHRNTMIDLVVLGCRVWSDSHGQGSGGTIYRGAYYGRNSADVGRAILSAMWDVRF